MVELWAKRASLMIGVTGDNPYHMLISILNGTMFKFFVVGYVPKG